MLWLKISIFYTDTFFKSQRSKSKLHIVCLIRNPALILLRGSFYICAHCCTVCNGACLCWLRSYRHYAANIVNYRQDAAKWQTAGILNLLTGPKSGFSPHRGDSLHRFTSNLAGPTGTWVRLAVQNFTSIAIGGDAAPKISKISTFW